MRARTVALVVTCVLGVTRAARAGPFVTVHTRDGSTFHGELVERVANDHMSLVLATGEVKRIPASDVQGPPPAHAAAPPSAPAPTETVCILDGSSFHGQIVEKVVGDHITLRLDTGSIRRFEWAELRRSSPLLTPTEFQPAPEVTVRTNRGRSYHGEIIEKVVGDHISLMLPDQLERRFEWNQLAEGEHLPPLQLRFTADQAAVLQQYRPDRGDFRTLCLRPCSLRGTPGTYRVIGDGGVGAHTFDIHGDSTIAAATRDRDADRGSTVLAIFGSIALTPGIFLTVAAATSSPTDVSMTFLATTLDLAAAAMLAVAFIWRYAPHASVTVNGVQR